jgi:hypothetical protein
MVGHGKEKGWERREGEGEEWCLERGAEGWKGRKGRAEIYPGFGLVVKSEKEVWGGIWVIGFRETFGKISD